MGLGLGLLALLGVDLVRRSWAGTADAARPIRPSSGALVICGGGRLPESVRDAFFDRAGGQSARIVVIPTASPAANDPAAVERACAVWRNKGAASVEPLHATSRTEADDPRFAARLANATGVWIGGGNQGWLTATYGGTAVERELRALVGRGGVVGGTSAGAAVMSPVMILGGKQSAMVGKGLSLFGGTVIDQHFLKRNRAKRLLGVLEQHPELIGFGIDEGTALVVDVRLNRVRVVGDSYVMACIPAADGGPARMEILKRGDEVHVDDLRRPDGGIASAIDLDAVLAE